jgi:wyosine [tRNA(Phe)-imidazoG37] synthetase (radical SAM superfamily)
MRYVFGPVPSRRLGQSLGIDPIPLKTCNWNCVYCQLGRTRPLTNQRKDYYPPQEILDEVRASLQAHQPGEIDWVTFVGSGEPLLHSSLGWLVSQVKKMTDLPVAVITNGSLLYLPEVRRDLVLADAVLPTLDAGTPELYRKINRPHPEVTFERLVDGLVAFRKESTGKLWVEVMLVRDINDTPQALWEIAKVLQKIGPDAVHINLPTRPPAETWVQTAREEALLQARAILGNIATVVHPAMGSFDLSGYDNLVEAILAIIQRHPMKQQELEQTLERWSPEQVKQTLAALEASGRAQIVERYGARFWSAAPSLYPDKAQSLRTRPGQRGQSREMDREEDDKSLGRGCMGES